jgi:hypothetical protein
LSPGGFNNWNWGQFGKSLAIGAVSGAVTGGIDIFSASLMKNVYGAIPGVLVKGGLSALGSGISGGLTNVILDGNWSSFGSGFGKGALVGGLMGGFSGGLEGFANAKSSAFERNLLWGGLTEKGREAALGHYTLQYELFQSGAMYVNFGDAGDSFGVTRPISPHNGRSRIDVYAAAESYPNGVNSEYILNSKIKMSLRKIEANVLHEKRHILDLHSGVGHEIWKSSGGNYEVWNALMEIRAHKYVLEHGFQKSYNLQRILHWQEILRKLQGQ